MLKHIIGLWLTHKLMPVIKTLVALFLLEFWIRELSNVSVIDEYQKDSVAATALLAVFAVVHVIAAVDYWTYDVLNTEI